MKSSPPLLEISITSSGSASMAVSTTVGIEVEIIQFGCWVFLETQEINFRDTLKVNMINIAFFYENFFHFRKKFLHLLTLSTVFSPTIVSIVELINDIKLFQQNAFGRLRSSDSKSVKV